MLLGSAPYGSGTYGGLTTSQVATVTVVAISPASKLVVVVPLAIVSAHAISPPGIVPANSLDLDFYWAFRDLYLATPSLIAAFPGGFYEIDKPISPQQFPYLVMSHLAEQEPGQSLDDRAIEVTFSIRGEDEDTVIAAAELLKAWLDPSGSPARPQLQWATGHEVFNWKDTSAAKKPDRRLKGGQNWYQFDIPYTFWILDSST